MSNIQHRQHKHNSTKQNYKRKEKKNTTKRKSSTCFPHSCGLLTPET